jgi:hypothetical protein
VFFFSGLFLFLWSRDDLSNYYFPCSFRILGCLAGLWCQSFVQLRLVERRVLFRGIRVMLNSMQFKQSSSGVLFSGRTSFCKGFYSCTHEIFKSGSRDRCCCCCVLLQINN